ncbi:MAG: ABC transporter permease [Clostridiales bacterium]|nr:ABC transporter permease [Clostridiales bacterium]
MQKQASLKAKLITSPYVAWAALFIVAPMFFVVYYAFTDNTGAFTFDNIKALSNYTEIFARSISFGLIATIICLLIAYPFAYILSQSGANVQKTMIMLIMLPMWMNFLIRTYSWMALLQDTGLINAILGKLGIGPFHMINTGGAVILGMIYNFLPYMILPIYSVLTKLDRSLVEAAEDLGSNRFNVIKKVVIPLSMPGVVSGITMVFVPSVSTFYISQKLGGGAFDLIGDTIEWQFHPAYNYNLGASLSMVLMLLILVCMAVMHRFTDNDEGGGMVI